MDRFYGKTALITGGTSGIGAAAAKLFAGEGCGVIIFGRNEERGRKIIDEIKTYGKADAEFFLCDVSSQKAVEDAGQAVKEKYDKLDILFNNAGIFMTSRLDNLNFSDWEKMMAVNVGSVMYTTKFFIDMLSESRGCIINNASITGMQSYTSGTSNYLYSASKAAQIKFTKLCALNYAETVRINAICPGIIDTEIYTNRDFSRFENAIPMRRIAEPNEVAKVVLFLASEDASYITGAVIPIDGGASLK